MWFGRAAEIEVTLDNGIRYFHERLLPLQFLSIVSQEYSVNMECFIVVINTIFGVMAESVVVLIKLVYFILG